MSCKEETYIKQQKQDSRRAERRANTIIYATICHRDSGWCFYDLYYRLTRTKFEILVSKFIFIMPLAVQIRYFIDQQIMIISFVHCKRHIWRFCRQKKILSILNGKGDREIPYCGYEVHIFYVGSLLRYWHKYNYTYSRNETVVRLKYDVIWLSIWKLHL